MKTPSDELFDLIKSLSGHEKGAFKLFSQHNTGDAKYIKLFDAMGAMEQYDEKKILLILKQHRGLNRIKDVKYNLQKVLIRFLQHYHNDDDVEIQLQKYLQAVSILFGKRLFSPAEKYLVKAEKMAADHHHFLYLLIILSWKREIMILRQDTAAIEAYEQEYYLSEIKFIDLYRNIVEYEKVFARVTRISINNLENPDKKAVAELKKILQNPILKNEKKARSLPAKIIYCRILGEIHLLLKNWEKGYAFLQQVAAYADQAGVSPVGKLRVFASLMVSLVWLKKSDELLFIKERATELVKSLPAKLQTISLYIPYTRIMTNYIHHQLSINQVNEALSASDEILKLAGKQVSSPFFLAYHGNLIYIYFLKTDYRKALYYANKVLSFEKTGIRQDIIYFTKLFTLIIHYELGNEELLPNLCKSCAPYFEKQKRQNKAEPVLLNFLGKTIHANPKKKAGAANKQNKIKLFIALKKDLEIYKTESIFKQFDFISWCDSKIQNRPMIEILKEKISLIPNPSPREKGA